MFHLLAMHSEPCTVAELAALADHHRNTIRDHLNRLVEAGQVERESAPAGTGPPPCPSSVPDAERDVSRRVDPDMEPWTSVTQPVG